MNLAAVFRSALRESRGARGRLLFFTGCLALGSLALSLSVVGPEIWLDDPYIGFRYGANLERGHGLVYNPGEQVEGYTAWLWVVLAWVAAVLDVDPLTFSQWINGASQVGTVWLAFHLGDRPGRSPWRALVAPALVATHLANVTFPPAHNVNVSWPPHLTNTSLWVFLVQEDFEEGPR